MSSSGLADDSATKSAAKSNIYVQPGATRLTEPLLPPKGSAATSHKPTVLPSAPCRRDQYSDYRNDYYIKQEQKKSDDDKEKDKESTNLRSRGMNMCMRLHILLLSFRISCNYHI